jgi:hypothetical protein
MGLKVERACQADRVEATPKCLADARRRESAIPPTSDARDGIAGERVHSANIPACLASLSTAVTLDGS